MDTPKENSPPKFHPYRDQHHKHNKFFSKSISFGDGTEHSHDSGYASTYISTNNIEHDASSLSAAGSFHVMTRDRGDRCTSALHLESIVEGIENGQFVQSSAAELTPTTRNITKINEFHITTPSSPSPVKRTNSSTSPLKRISNSPLTRIDNKLMRLDSTTPHKPKDATALDGNVLSGRKLWQQCREPLRSKLNVDDDNVFLMDENSIGSPSIGIRPDNGGLPIAGVLQENIKRKFCRNASEHILHASTPINYDNLNQAKGNTITRGSNVERPRSFAARNNVLQKTESFSPSKHFQSMYGASTRSIVSDLPVLPKHSPNPARKLLDFNADKFETLFQPTEKILKRQNAIDMTTGYLNKSPSRHTITSSQSLNDSLNITATFNVFEGEKTPPNIFVMSFTPPKFDAMDLCSPIIDHVLPSPVEENSATEYMLKNCSNSSGQFDMLLHSDIVPESPPSPQKRSTGIVDDTQRTPEKQSCGFTVFNSSPRHEQNCILYPKLHRTPPRNNQRVLKRSQHIQRTPVKRKLYRRLSLDGYERLDILGRLEDILPARLVLQYLSNKELSNVAIVSKRWCRIVNSYMVTNRRLQPYRCHQSGDKENDGRLGVNVPLASFDKNIKSVRAPFTRRNTFDQNPTSSLNKINCTTLSTKEAEEKVFLDNLKLVKSLKPNQSVMKCPRCQATSVVHNPSESSALRTTTKLKKSLSVEYRAPSTSLFSFRKQDSFPLLDGTSSAHHQNKDSMSSPVLPFTPPIGQLAEEQLESFAKCSSNSCGYRFCPKCLCDFHLNGNCMSREIGAFGDIKKSNGRHKEYVAGSKESKRNLRRLCSLNN